MKIILSSFKYRSECGSQKGFTMVELIVTIVLVGIIGTFTTLFVYTGLNGYLRARDTSEGALKAQITLDRLSAELRDVDFIDPNTWDPDDQIDFTSRSLPGNRQILHSNGVISINGGSGARELLRDVENFSMSIAKADLDADGNVDDVQAIDISFNTQQIGRQFSARIFPRFMVEAPP